MLVDLCTYLIYALVGLVVGSLCSLLFFRMDAGWKQVLVAVFGSGGSVGLFASLTYLCNINGHDFKIGLLTTMIVFFICGAAVAFYVLCKTLKNQDGHNIIRVLDIVMGHVDFIKNYYDTRKKEIDAKLNFEEIDKKNKELDTREKELNEKWDIQEKKLRAREMKMDEVEERMKEQLHQQICLDIPIDNHIPITKEFIQLLPDYIIGMAKFINDITNYTDEFCSKIPVDATKEELEVRLKSYFLGICTFTITDLFNDGKTNRIRAHIRTLKDDKVYISLVATTGMNIYPKELTPIPKKIGMISKSFEVKRALIKSLNSEFDFESNNHTVWEDYITFTFNDISKDKVPFLSMGISVKNKERYKNIMYFLNFCKFEHILQENVDKVNEKCDILNVLSI